MIQALRLSGLNHGPGYKSQYGLPRGLFRSVLHPKADLLCSV
jgi:hypothetical protein